MAYVSRGHKNAVLSAIPIEEIERLFPKTDINLCLKKQRIERK